MRRLCLLATLLVACANEPSSDGGAPSGEGSDDAGATDEPGAGVAEGGDEGGEGEGSEGPTPSGGEGEGEGGEAGPPDPAEGEGEGDGGEGGGGGIPAEACDTHDDCEGRRVCLDDPAGPRCGERNPIECASDRQCDEATGERCDRMLDRCALTSVCACEPCAGEGGGRCPEDDPCLDNAGCRPGRSCEAGRCVPASCEGDRFEDDDSPGRAASLKPRRYAGLLLCGEETDDWFRVKIAPGRGLLVVLRPDDPSNAPDMALYHVDDSARPVLGLAASGGPGARWVARAASPGAQEVLIRVVGLRAATATYSLTVHQPETGPCVNDADDRRIGDDRPRPVPESDAPLVLCPDDVDVFEVEAPPDAALRVALHRTGDRGDLRATLRGPDGVVAGRGAPAPGGWRAEAETHQAGTWSITVTGAPPAGGLTYSLDVRVVQGAARWLCQEVGELAEGEVAGEIDGEPLDPGLSCAPSPGPAKAWRMRLDAPRRVLLSASGGAIALRRDCARTESELQCAKDGTDLDIERLEAGEYTVVLQGPDGGGPFAMDLRTAPPAPPPEHDRCDAARPVSPDAPQVGSTWSATDDSVAEACGGAPGGVDVFYRIELEEEAQVSVAVEGAGDVHIEARRACAGPFDAPSMCLNAPAILGPGAWVIMIDGVGPEDRGDHTLVVRTAPPPPPPANAACEGATPMVEGEDLRADTRRGGDRRDATGCGAGPSGRELAFSLPNLPVALVTVESDFDALVYGVRGCAEDPEEVFCRAAGRHATLRLEDPPEDLVVFVDGASPADGGAFSITAKAPPAVEDDTCNGAPRAMPLQVGGSTAGAGRDLDPGPGCAGPFPLAGPDVAYALSLAAGDTLDAELRPAGWDGALYVLDGCNDEAAGCVAGVDEGLLDEPERLTWTAERAGTVLLVVDAFGAGGDYRLDVAVADRNR